MGTAVYFRGAQSETDAGTQRHKGGREKTDSSDGYWILDCTGANAFSWLVIQLAQHLVLEITGH